MRVACVSVDLDSLPHYCRIHGLDESLLPEAARDLVHEVALPRLLELCASVAAPLTCFAIGEDLERERCRWAVGQAAKAGAEIGNHSHAHDYALTRLTREQMHRDLERAEAAIAGVTGERPRGFRAPGYTLTAALYQVLLDRGYRYDSSAFPAAPYWAAKAAVMGVLKAVGRPSRAVLDSPRVLLAPREPYRPDPARPYARGGGEVLELPVATGRVTRFPFIGTFAASLPRPAVRALYRDARDVQLFNFELHGVDLLDEEDGIPAALARAQRDLLVPHALKLSRLRDVLGWLRDDYQLLTLGGAAAEWCKGPASCSSESPTR